MNDTTEIFFLDNPWAQIEDPCYPAGRRLYLQDERFWVSMDDERQILFFIQDRGGDKIKTLENLAELDVAIEACDNGDHRLVCRLTSHEPGLIEKFAIMAKDIAFHSSSYKGQQLFLQAQERIKSWANFLKPSRSGLTNSEFIGFFGELYVLSEFFIDSFSSDVAVRAWVGPEDKKQDFTLNHCAVEVKTSRSGDQQTIKISSLDQLDRVTNELYLLRVVISPSGDGEGLSLEMLYEKCLEAVGHDVLAEGLFIQKASELYGKANKRQINDMFKIVSVVAYDVSDEFPKLTSGHVDLAIPNVKYEISLGALSSFEMDGDIKEIINNG